MLTRTDDASNTLFSDRYQQTYHSTFGAVAESRHVYLDGTKLTTRLNDGKPTRVLEIGLGLGLNCLLAADCASTHRTQLHYTGIEHDLISEAQFTALDYRQLLVEPALADDFMQILLEAHDTKIPDINPADKPNVGQYTRLELHIGDATSASLLDKLATGAPYHAIFLDAFSPEHNPECWTLAFFERLRGLLVTDGWLASYCVKGDVQRNLRAAGFSVHKFPGPAGKREVLRACKR